ncbi:MAG: DUF3494 domain-containing protein [Kineosporiaceae bacterium]|nr:DUF3494 domain-containing protein [Aeromicrobium sp.]
MLAGGDVTIPGATIFGDIGAQGALTVSATPGSVHGRSDTATNGAMLDLLSAYRDLSNSDGSIDITGTDLGGLTIYPGRYHSGSTIAVTDTLTFDASNNPNAVFIIESGSSIITAVGTQMVLINGASFSNIYWVASGGTYVHAMSTFDGNIVSFGPVTVGASTTLNGRAMSVESKVTLGNSCTITRGLVSPPSTPASILKTASNFAVIAGSVVTGNHETVFGDIGAGHGIFTDAHPGTIHPLGDFPSISAANDLTGAYVNLTSLPVDVELANADLGGTTLTPGVYNKMTALTATGTVTFDAQNNSDAIFVVRMGSTLITSLGTKMVLKNGAKSANIYWLIGGAVSLGANSTFDGNILSMADITVGDHSAINGRALSENGAVALGDFCTITVG